MLGGAGASTVKRYRAVFDKFTRFARQSGVGHWQSVSKCLVESYGSWLDDEGYAYASEYLELTTLKQAINWLIQQKLIPPSCQFQLPLKKATGTSTYCYSSEQVSAMLEHCRAHPELHWLADVLVALAHTGLRISELAGLRWSDVNWQANLIRLVDERHRASKPRRPSARSTKSHRDRSLPIHAQLRQVLEALPHHADGRIFHGPKGGALKPDTLRNILLRKVLRPLAKRFPAQAGQAGFVDGRLHSFRHYFCSACANNGVPEQVLMNWLGHRDSKMIRHYFHLHDQEAQRQMTRIQFVGAAATATVAAAQPT